jgi:hypothetical protein
MSKVEYLQAQAMHAQPPLSKGMCLQAQIVWPRLSRVEGRNTGLHATIDAEAYLERKGLGMVIPLLLLPLAPFFPTKLEGESSPRSTLAMEKVFGNGATIS